MKALEAAVSLLLLVAMLPMVPIFYGGDDRRAAQYAIAEDMLSTLYARHGTGMFYCSDPVGLEADIVKMAKMSGACVSYETPFCAIESGCDGAEAESVSVNHDSIAGNVRLSVKR
jgi:hypothetical protein